MARAHRKVDSKNFCEDVKNRIKEQRMKIKKPVARKLFDVHFVVFREGEMTFADIHAAVTNEVLLTDASFLFVLKRAITKWVKETDEGAIWEQSSEYMNIGDIADYPDTLCPYLNAEGIYYFAIEIKSYEGLAVYWTYDTILVNEDELKEE